MKNVIYTDSEFMAFLLKNEEQQGNSIEFEIDADDTESQELTIVAGTTTETFTITPETINSYLLSPELWSYGGETVLTLNKDGTDTDSIVITFPDKVDTDASLNQTSVGHYSMQGSASLQEQIVSIQESIENISTQIIDYITPTSIDQTPIGNGENHDIMTFEFYSSTEGEKSSFYSLLNYEVETAVGTGDIYGDCTITFTFKLDNSSAATLIVSGGDCYKETMLNFLLENLSKGNHTFVVNMAVTGGSVS